MKLDPILASPRRSCQKLSSSLSLTFDFDESLQNLYDIASKAITEGNIERMELEKARVKSNKRQVETGP